MFGAIAGGIASALAGGAMSKLFGGGQKAASGGIQGDVLATDNTTRSEERFSRNAEIDTLSLHDALPICIASALAGGAMSKLFGGGQKAASGGIQGDVLATDNNTVGMGDAGI